MAVTHERCCKWDVKKKNREKGPSIIVESICRRLILLVADMRIWIVLYDTRILEWIKYINSPKL